MQPIVNEIYKHFKGNLYKVITLATHSETEEEMVVYQALYGDYKVYCRPLSSFMSEVDHEKYPDVTQKMRFELLNSGLKLAQNSIQNVQVEETTPNAPCIAPENATENEADNNNELNPYVEEFLNADTNEARLEILHHYKNKFSQHDLTIMSIFQDIALDENLDFDERFRQFSLCLTTKNKYETLRLR